MCVKTIDGEVFEIGRFAVIDQSYEKDGKSGLLVADFDTRDEAVDYMELENNPNYVLFDQGGRDA